MNGRPNRADEAAFSNISGVVGMLPKSCINYIYYMTTIVRTLRLAAERALFSCNDRAL